MAADQSLADIAVDEQDASITDEESHYMFVRANVMNRSSHKSKHTKLFRYQINDDGYASDSESEEQIVYITKPILQRRSRQGPKTSQPPLSAALSKVKSGAKLNSGRRPSKSITFYSEASNLLTKAKLAILDEEEQERLSTIRSTHKHRTEEIWGLGTAIPSRTKTERLWKHFTVRHASHLSFPRRGPESKVSFSDKLKRAVEEYLGNKVLWWPLRPINSRPKPSEDHVSWKCDCGAHFNLSVHYLFNLEIIDQVMSNKAHNAGNTPILPTHQTQSSGVAPGASQQPSVPFGSQSGPSSIRQRSERSFNNASTETQNTSSRATSSANARKYLHWCVNSHRTITKLVELETDEISEESLVTSLLAAYTAVRGVYSWLTLTSCAGVKFVKFRRLAVKAEYVTHLKDELPCRKSNQEYQYQYCDDPTTPEEDFVKWLQAVIAVRLAYPNCPETLALCNALEYIPKKVNGRMKTLDGYGMQATSAYCFWKAVLALFIASIPSGIFMIRWLAGHGGDWQNALGLLAVTYSLLNILVLQHDRWSIETSR